MHPIHQSIISHIRNSDPQDEELSPLTDNQILYLMFFNYRNDKGLRLSKIGLEIMQKYFEKGYTIEIPKNETVLPIHLIFLDKKATMPYYCGKKEIITYDKFFGVMLRLLDGSLNNFVKIENN